MVRGDFVSTGRDAKVDGKRLRVRMCMRVCVCVRVREKKIER